MESEKYMELAKKVLMDELNEMQNDVFTVTIDAARGVTSSDEIREAAADMWVLGFVNYVINKKEKHKKKKNMKKEKHKKRKT